MKTTVVVPPREAPATRLATRPTSLDVAPTAVSLGELR
jgi:hypothetical protein